MVPRTKLGEGDIGHRIRNVEGGRIMEISIPRNGSRLMPDQLEAMLHELNEADLCPTGFDFHPGGYRWKRGYVVATGRIGIWVTPDEATTARKKAARACFNPTPNGVRTTAARSKAGGAPSTIIKMQPDMHHRRPAGVNL